MARHYLLTPRGQRPFVSLSVSDGRGLAAAFAHKRKRPSIVGSAGRPSFGRSQGDRRPRGTVRPARASDQHDPIGPPKRRRDPPHSAAPGAPHTRAPPLEAIPRRFVDFRGVAASFLTPSIQPPKASANVEASLKVIKSIRNSTCPALIRYWKTPVSISCSFNHSRTSEMLTTRLPSSRTTRTGYVTSLSPPKVEDQRKG